MVAHSFRDSKRTQHCLFLCISSFTADRYEATASGIAEEHLTDRSVKLNDVDIDLPTDKPSGYVEQLTAIRFDNAFIQRGATITNAHIQFTSFAADDAISKYTVKVSMRVSGEKSGRSSPLAATTSNISQRIKTINTVTWAPPRWDGAGKDGSAQKTSDLYCIIQEIVAQPDWVPGNSILILFERSSSVSLTQPDRRRAVFGGAGTPVLTLDFKSLFSLLCSKS
jgi:hypothetical protein